MVVHAFPLAKLGSLLLRQVSKPIANFLKERAKQHPFFRTYLLMPPAQFYNWCEVKMKMYALNLGKPVTVARLNEATAIDLGGDILGEFIVFFIAGAILTNEYVKQMRKEADKKEASQQEMNQLMDTIRDLNLQLEMQAVEIQELNEVVQRLQGKKKR
ncbi:putative OPA3-like protein CG13603 [Nilaparvata lugens]|uniref:putative OPA3-like protein CG13603 n=1 Tax=Nilaparvata lugens TaxID=108931 RepID=UPI000B98A5E0|nr:putative OPA3-like protein CG13603 [Nilaparvata lugens]